MRLLHKFSCGRNCGSALRNGSRIRLFFSSSFPFCLFVGVDALCSSCGAHINFLVAASAVMRAVTACRSNSSCSHFSFLSASIPGGCLFVVPDLSCLLCCRFIFLEKKSPERGEGVFRQVPPPRGETATDKSFEGWILTLEG